MFSSLLLVIQNSESCNGEAMKSLVTNEDHEDYSPPGKSDRKEQDNEKGKRHKGAKYEF